MFERLTDRARRVLVVAQEEAKDFHHEFIRPEHLLVGLAQGEGLAARALGEVGVTPERLRAQVGATIERSKADHVGPKLPFSPDARRHSNAHSDRPFGSATTTSVRNTSYLASFRYSRTTQPSGSSSAWTPPMYERAWTS